jgi:CRISPR-associated protein Cas2
MEMLVAYDVATDTAAGRRRLRHVAKICLAHGQRVQKSVFEVTLDAATLEVMKHRLRRAIDPAEDSLRLYRLQEPRARNVEEIGRPLEHDLHEPLVL